MRLRDALNIQRGDVVAFIGAGGKTSALFRLGYELHEEGWRVLATTTTRLARQEITYAPFAARLTPHIKPETIREWLNAHGFVFLYSREDKQRNKIIGLHPNVIPGLIDSVDSDVLLIEADGARRLPLKAPYAHEPVIPPDVSLVVPVAGIDALGQPLDDDHIYNATAIRERYGFPEGGTVRAPWMAVTLRDPELGLRGVPDKARVVVLLNKVSTSSYGRARARRIAQLVLRSPRVGGVVLGAMLQPGDPVHELQQRVAAVVLAAGTSSRMGQSKALLPWGDQTVIEAIVSRLVTARVSDIVVVTGHRSNDVARALADQAIQIVYNPNFAQGEMLSSLQAGLRRLDASVSACLVVLGDQPSLETRVINRILMTYAEGKGDIVAPAYRGERGNPVLIGQRFWPELLALESGAPRDVIRRHPDKLAVVDVDSDSILRDIDTPEQYHRERRLAGLP